jgi:DNA repair protein RecO (recombination protein O)
LDTRAETVQAIVLRTIAYGEADLVVHLLARGKGRVSAFARGARTSARRYGGSLEPFHLVEVLLAERAGQDLSLLREARVVEAHAGLRDDLSRIAHAGYAAELAHDLTRPSEPADALFALLLDFFARLAVGSATSARLRALELAALDAAGLSPELERCARCGIAIPMAKAAFDPDAGGVVCPSCAQPSALLLTLAARAALRQLKQGGLAAADAPLSADGSGRPADPRGFEDAAAQAARPMAAFVRHHLGRGLRSAGFLAQVGAPL